MIRVFQVPYDSGHRAERMGLGPSRIARDGRLVDRLREATGRSVDLVPVEIASTFPTEIGTAFELHRALAQGVAATAGAGGLPLTLSGNCNSAVGTVAGLQAAGDADDLAIVWLDGHGDSNTPETFVGDFLDAMGLSTLTGRCWQALTRTVPGFRPVLDRRVLLVGGHGMDEGARGVLDGSGVTVRPAAAVADEGAERALAPVLEAWSRQGVRRVYVHLDVDVLDAGRVAPANGFAPASGGLLAHHPAEVAGVLARRFAIAGAAVASYDPSLDRQDRVLDAALAFLERAALTASS